MGFLGEMVSGISNIGATILQNRAQKKESELAYQRDINMWNMSNAYNTPAMQMQRFKEAGLNPNLIYGQGNAGNTAVNMPRYSPANIQYRSPLSAIADYVGIKSQVAQTNNINAQTENTLQRTINEKRRQIILEAQGRIQKELSSYAPELGFSKYQQEIAKVATEQSRSALASTQMAVNRARTNQISQLLQLQKNALDTSIQFNKERTLYQQLQNKWLDSMNYGKLGNFIMNAVGGMSRFGR